MALLCYACGGRGTITVPADMRESTPMQAGSTPFFPGDPVMARTCPVCKGVKQVRTFEEQLALTPNMVEVTQ